MSKRRHHDMGGLKAGSVNREEREYEVWEKKVDAIIANPLETMESNQITATVYCKNGKTITPPNNLPKSDFAFWLIQNLEDITATI